MIDDPNEIGHFVSHTKVKRTTAEMAAEFDRITRPLDRPSIPLGFDPDDYPINEPPMKPTLKRITRDRLLTPEEAADYKDVREKIKQELPDLIARHQERMSKMKPAACNECGDVIEKDDVPVVCKDCKAVYCGFCATRDFGPVDQCNECKHIEEATEMSTEERQLWILRHKHGLNLSRNRHVEDSEGDS